MKKKLTKLCMLAISVALTTTTVSQAQILFSEDFDGINGPTAGGAGTYSFPAGWTLINNDALAPAAAVSYVNDAWERREDFSFNVADSCAFSTSWYGTPGTSDDWMITPAITLTTNNLLYWSAVAYDPLYADGYEVRISTTTPDMAGCLANPALFTIANENTAWTNRSIDLQALGYSNQTVYIAFRNNSTDLFLLLIDNIMVSTVVNYDALVTQVNPVSEYTQVPLLQAGTFNLGGDIANNGLMDITNVNLVATVYNSSAAPVPSPVPGHGQAVVTVKAAGVNFPDTLIIQNKYQFKPPLPFSPGAEMAGIVKAVGDGVANVKLGDAVCGLGLWGAFAEEVLIDASALSVLPPAMPFDVAGSFALTYCTSYHALADRGELKSGETLLVLGAAGGVGLAAVELGKAAGARVIAAASNDEKLAVCRRHGADETINYSTENLRERIKVLTSGKGVDVIYDPVGGSLSELALRDMAWRGRHLVVGFAAGEIPKIPLNLLLLKGCSIVGVFWGGLVRQDPGARDRIMQQLFGLYAAKKISPLVSARYPLERAADALNAVLLRKVTGKVVLEP